MPPCSPAQSGTAAAALGVVVQHSCTGPKQSWARSRPCSASAEGARAGLRAGVCRGWKEPSFNLPQTPAPHTPGPPARGTGGLKL